MRLVDITERIDPLVATPAVGHHRRSWLDVGSDEGVERVGRSVGEDGHAAAAKAFWPSALDCDANQDLFSFLATAAQSWLLATEVRLVHLHRARQTVPAGSDKHRAQPRCSSAHAVGYEPISSSRCRLRAEMPFVCAANIQQAVNQTVSGVRRRSKSVPAVTDVLAPQTAHL